MSVCLCASISDLPMNDAHVIQLLEYILDVD